LSSVGSDMDAASRSSLSEPQVFACSLAGNIGKWV